jgi:hypothetical protein
MMQPGFANCLSNYMHVPDSLIEQISEPVNNPTVEQKVPSEEERRLRDRIQLLKRSKK